MVYETLAWNSILAGKVKGELKGYSELRSFLVINDDTLAYYE